MIMAKKRRKKIMEMTVTIRIIIISLESCKLCCYYCIIITNEWMHESWDAFYCVCVQSFCSYYCFNFGNINYWNYGFRKWSRSETGWMNEWILLCACTVCKSSASSAVWPHIVLCMTIIVSFMFFFCCCSNIEQKNKKKSKKKKRKLMNIVSLCLVLLLNVPDLFNNDSIRQWNKNYGHTNQAN